MKTVVNPMHSAQRCSARSKRTGLPCGAPAVRGWNVCRIHGAGGGAPPGPSNGRFRTGYWTKEAVAARAALRALLKQCREVIGDSWRM